MSSGTLLPSVPFCLARLEQPIPASPVGVSALRGPVDRRGAYPQEGGSLEQRGYFLSTCSRLVEGRPNVRMAVISLTDRRLWVDSGH